MYKRIKEIAKVQSGVYLKNEPQGEVFYLQVKDFNSNCEIADWEKLKPTLTYDTRTLDHLLKDGDLLFAAKGTFNFCVIYNKEIGEAVASSSFIVIRIWNTNQVLPEYLAWFFNHPQTMQYLKLNAKGTAILSISKATIENMDMYIPSIEKQKQIVQLANLQKHEKWLREEITRRRETFIDNLLMQSITE